MNTAGTSVIPELAVMRVVKSEIRTPHCTRTFVRLLALMSIPHSEFRIRH